MNSAEFIQYITKELTMEEMTLLYKANNINYDKCNLYYEFIMTLNRKVNNTFLGDDVINNEEDIKNHFNWCFNHTIKNFSKEGILFMETDLLKEYFFNFYVELFYYTPTKKDILDKLDKFPNMSFDYYRLKTRSDMDVLLELYRIFEKSLDYKLKM
tara:strand:- start:13694 stop:14161 length:468 start_codon:yes stop_codon:yes gene_type:complete